MNNGDIVKFDYELWIVENDKKTLFETTLEETAKANGIYDPNVKYKPMVTIIGKKMLIQAFEDSIINAEVGKEVELTIEPEKAYGVRNNKFVKVHSFRDFQKENVEPEVGKFVTLNKKTGKVLRVTPGRVVVDYNNPLAGKTLFYKYTVREIVTDLKGQISSIIEIRYGMDVDKFEITINDDIQINLAESAKYKQEWANSKFGIVGDIREKTDKAIKFIETYIPEKKAEEKPVEEKK
ncbi:MAG: FKBP-type peptidyl-prolyl cis-trans isomerase [Thermoplasmata archaeon]